jgi:Ca2+/Na+ antiporter
LKSLENLGPVFGISDYVMGVVFAAAGTSFPNVLASMVVAKQGLGNAAISNAVGTQEEKKCLNHFW